MVMTAPLGKFTKKKNQCALEMGELYGTLKYFNKVILKNECIEWEKPDTKMQVLYEAIYLIPKWAKLI